MSSLSFNLKVLERHNIHPSVLCPESVPQAPMLRLTKRKGSENDGHNAAMRTSRRKCVHWVLKMFINQIQFCVVGNCKHSSSSSSHINRLM